MTFVSPLLTFPNIRWWMQILAAEAVVFDGHEFFQKMSYRNRYRISGSNNPILLSVPLAQGRDQHTAMKEIRIFNQQRWQVQHWRTLESVYKRTPYFEHYEYSLRPLFETTFDGLADFNRQTIGWTKQQLKLNFEEQETESYIKDYPADIIDLRKPEAAPATLPIYYQVFEDRIGFQPDLSILDLLFSEGPQAINYLKDEQ